MWKSDAKDVMSLGCKKQSITNTLALSIDKMLYIYLLCSHFEHQNNPFQSKQSKHFHKEIGLPNVKLILIR